ncbi:MAG: hypothetical protein KF770_25745 [Anaerolineae bacterium]|nr:hypothetical protein [Anaerolineae bacterium]
MYNLLAAGASTWAEGGAVAEGGFRKKAVFVAGMPAIWVGGLGNRCADQPFTV